MTKTTSKASGQSIFFFAKSPNVLSKLVRHFFNIWNFEY